MDKTMKKTILARVLAGTGTFLACIPVIAPLFFTAGLLLTTGEFRFDYLMPAELFPFVLAGGILLLCAAIVSRRRVSPVAWSFSGAIVCLILSQGLAVLTGLASGEAEASGWRMALVVSFLAGYALLVVIFAVSGILLIKDLFARKPEITQSP